jgi:hypothetical protein
MIRTTIHDRRIEIPAPDDLPDGTEVEIELTPVLEQLGIAESETCDTAQSLDDWSNWLTTIEPVDFAEPDAFDEQFRQANIEAVRQQMFGETP